MDVVTANVLSWGVATMSTSMMAAVIQSSKPGRAAQKSLDRFPDWVQAQLESRQADEPAVEELERAVSAVLYPLAPPLPVVQAVLHPAAGRRFAAHVS